MLPIPPTPTFHRGTLLFVAGQDLVIANSENGKRLWEHDDSWEYVNHPSVDTEANWAVVPRVQPGGGGAWFSDLMKFTVPTVCGDEKDEGDEGTDDVNFVELPQPDRSLSDEEEQEDKLVAHELHSIYGTAPLQPMIGRKFFYYVGVSPYLCFIAYDRNTAEMVGALEFRAIDIGVENVDVPKYNAVITGDVIICCIEERLFVIRGNGKE